MPRLASFPRFLMALVLTMVIGAVADTGPAPAEALQAELTAIPWPYLGCVGYCSAGALEYSDQKSDQWMFYNGCLASCYLF